MSGERNTILLRVWGDDNLITHTYEFAPQPDITTFELAQILPMFVPTWMHDIGNLWKDWPDTVKRHWKEVP